MAQWILEWWIAGRKEDEMGSKNWGKLVFWLGVLVMNLTTSVAYLWLVLGLPMLPVPGIMGAFAPPLGAALIFVSGIIYGRAGREVTA